LRGSRSSCALPERWHTLAIETTSAVSAHRAAPTGAAATGEQPEAEPDQIGGSVRGGCDQ